MLCMWDYILKPYKLNDKKYFVAVLISHIYQVMKQNKNYVWHMNLTIRLIKCLLTLEAV